MKANKKKNKEKIYYSEEKELNRENVKGGSSAAWLIPVLTALGLAGKIAIDQYTLVKPEWPEERTGEPVPPIPGEDDTPFHRTPVAPTYNKRRKLFLEWAAEQETPEDGYKAIWAQLIKMEAGQENISPAVLRWSLDFVNARSDCSDFVVNGLLRLYYKYAGTGRLKPEQENQIKEALLGFIYWMDEPNHLKTDIIQYTENHQILFHTAEYLAGQLFPDEVFTNNGQTGKWHMEHAIPLIYNWIDFHSRTGFSEWDSVNYYPLNLVALLNLVEFCADKDISTRAAMMVDLILLDVAVDSFYGQYGSTHGRAEAEHIKSAAGDTMVTTQAILWGLGRFQSVTEFAAASFVTGSKYKLPMVLQTLAQDMPEEMTNFERHSIEFTENDAFFHDISFNRVEDMPCWLGKGVFLRPQLIDTMVKMADEWDLWHFGGGEFEKMKKLVVPASRLGLLNQCVDKLGIDIAGAELTEVNKVTYRTPDYMLSCAQDYRKGEMGFQQHIWQATLSPYAVVFVTNPDALTEDGTHRPDYWAGNGRLPRAAQHENFLISLHDIDRNRGLLEKRHYAFTHAYFPRFAFDRVEEKKVFPGGGGWVFGKKDDGYVALYSHLPFVMQYIGPDTGRELIALGRRNVWICLMGRRATDGTFDEFMEAILNSSLRVEGLNVDFDVPRHGRATFGWDAPLTVKGEEIPLRDYLRWDNPYCRAEFNTNQFKISHDGRELCLDFGKNTRVSRNVKKDD